MTSALLVERRVRDDACRYFARGRWLRPEGVATLAGIWEGDPESCGAGGRDVAVGEARFQIANGGPCGSHGTDP